MYDYDVHGCLTDSSVLDNVTDTVNVKLLIMNQYF